MPAPKSHAPLDGRTVLVVEDDDDVRDMIAFSLRARGAAVLDAADGVTARETLARNQVDLVITDIAMPSESGIEMMERIRTSHPATRLPAVAISGALRTDELSSFAPALFHAVLTKPFDPARLVAIVTDLLDG